LDHHKAEEGDAVRTIFWDLIEGGENGQKVAESANVLMNKFFNLGIKNIENE
jgi:hypothetical protein